MEREKVYLLYRYCHDQNEIIKIRRLVKCYDRDRPSIEALNCIEMHSVTMNTHMNLKLRRWFYLLQLLDHLYRAQWDPLHRTGQSGHGHSSVRWVLIPPQHRVDHLQCPSFPLPRSNKICHRNRRMDTWPDSLIVFLVTGNPSSSTYLLHEWPWAALQGQMSTFRVCSLTTVSLTSCLSLYLLFVFYFFYGLISGPKTKLFYDDTHTLSYYPQCV